MAGEDRTDRVLNALDTSTRVTTEVMAQFKNLSREFGTLKSSQEKGFGDMRETFRLQLDNIDDELKTTTAHLDNLIREATVANRILQEDMASRQIAENERRIVEKEEREWRRKTEQEEREWRRKLEDRQLTRKETVEDDTRGMVKKGLSEAWTIAKQPLGYLVAGLVFWMLIQYLRVPSPMAAGVLPAPHPVTAPVPPHP